MYSRSIEASLKRKHITIGDLIRVTRRGKTWKGLLMPKTDMGDPSCLVIKLDSGYNIGIKVDSIEKIRSGDKRMGKVSPKLLKLSFDPKKPVVSLVSTGGTIASRIDYRTGGVYAADDPKEFLHSVPELGKVINLKHITKPVNRMGEDMSHKDWITIAKAVHSELKRSVGVIVTHGTDTLHYLSAALSFFLQDLKKPVVLVGSQKSSDRGSSDVGMNLLCAAHVATGPIAEVGVCMHATMNDDACLFIRGTKVRKMHTIRRDAFRPINDLPLARVYPSGKIEQISSVARKRASGETTLDARFESKIALLKTHPSADPEVIDYYLGKGYKGFVIEGTGLGHVPTFAEKSWIPHIKKTVKDGIPVVVTPQTIYGRVDANVYTNLRILFHDAQAIPGDDLTSETAFVKLGWILAHTQDLDEVRKRMHTNYVGEQSVRGTAEMFLY